MASSPIYLDNFATTPCDPLVIEIMVPFFGTNYSNPSSSTHEGGRNAMAAVSRARECVSSLIGCSQREIVFTSGATESNNLVIKGISNLNSDRKKIITTKIEHEAVLQTVDQLRNDGFEVIELGVTEGGTVDLNQFHSLIDEDTLLVTVMLVNNEIGTIQPVKEIADVARKAGALVHSDAAQGVGKIPVDVNVLGVDFLSTSAHKMYGPKGVGALYVRGGAAKTKLEPLMFGGGQESELRPGTLNVPGIVGFGKACEISQENLESEIQRITELRNQLQDNIEKTIPGAVINAKESFRIPGSLSITFPGIDAEALIMNMPELALSTGSACKSGAPSPSHVLEAIGIERELAYCTLRVCLGRFTTEKDIEIATSAFSTAYKHLANLNSNQ